MIEVTQDQAQKLAGILFFDVNGQPYVFKDGALLIIRPSREKEEPIEDVPIDNPL